MYKLVIAEKPSVAQSIAKVLGCTGRRDGYLEGNGYLVSWCVGHLVDLAEPEEYDGKYETWRREDLPILPDTFKYKVGNQTKKQFKVLKELFSRKDVDCVINACDAGREGELIFRLVYEKAGCRKPMKRLWISSMEDEAILNGFENLKDGSEYDKLYEAALCRERADWMVGINATRFFSTLYDLTLNVGRVMTPTLALVVEREAQIRAFKPEDIYTVILDTEYGKLSSIKYKDADLAGDVLEACVKEGSIRITKAHRQEKKENAPALFDLTALQREANRKLGYTAQQTLDYTQALYEKKLVSYPRTDSRYLTEDMEAALPDLIAKAVKVSGCVTTEMKDLKAVINGKRVTDHHAIIPTASVDKADMDTLPSGEREVLKLIAARLLEAVSSPCLYVESTVEGECAGEKFSAKGKTVVGYGWRAVAGNMPEKDKDSEETEINIPGNLIGVKDITINKGSIKTGKTAAPKSFTEDTLLSAMERAGSDEIPDEAERKGLGTPATRAGIIEKLVRIGFIERKGEKKTKYLVPTNKGEMLVTVIPEAIQSASMTAEWEQKLLEIEKGSYSSEKFMDEIKDLVRNLVETYEKLPAVFNFERSSIYGKKTKYYRRR
ncbi:MAG: DNA topoisomerase 3 [Lachnospiraceae bacterium]|nr:DNA topoisomerase 3 [Lachnospiraceae bacterium]